MFVCQVDPWLSVSAAHNIGEAVRHQLRMHHPNVTESFVHIGLSTHHILQLEKLSTGIFILFLK